MSIYDLCLAWNWEYDADFVVILNKACVSKRLSLLQARPDNIASLLRSLVDRQIDFKAFLDRAAEDDPAFMPLVRWASEHNKYCINPYEEASRTWDKAGLHPTLFNAGLPIPYTIIVPSYEEQPILSSIDVQRLGDRFTIKPAHGSGGEGVVTEATSLAQVLFVRQESPTDRYLLQAYVMPREFNGRPAWFRVIYCGGRVYPCWWDPHSHVHTPVTAAEERCCGLSPLRDTVLSLAHLCGLDLFSTELAFTNDGLFVVVDYVNDPIDLRLQSKAVDGVPDKIVHDIAERLVDLVATRH